MHLEIHCMCVAVNLGSQLWTALSAHTKVHQSHQHPQYIPSLCSEDCSVFTSDSMAMSNFTSKAKPCWLPKPINSHQFSQSSPFPSPCLAVRAGHVTGDTSTVCQTLGGHFFNNRLFKMEKQNKPLEEAELTSERTLL